MSGHGQREVGLLVDAIHWRHRVITDVKSADGLSPPTRIRSRSNSSSRRPL
jgi:hypothetical protein